MTKREIIDEIIKLNPSASPQFLAGFSERELADYLGQLVGISNGTRGAARPDVRVSALGGLGATAVRGRPDPAP